MFIEAIETAAKFTRALHSISRNYGSDQVVAGAATLFLINSDGWALTCGHVAYQIVAGNVFGKKYASYKDELASRKGEKKLKQLKKELSQKYGYSKNVTIELRNRFMNCLEGDLNLKIFRSQKFDVALVKFNNFARLLCNSFPVFPKDTTGLKQGKFLCRLGFPFPEFANFTYDDKTESINWTNEGRPDSPRFPIEGMLTRHLVKDGNVIGFEMSTPGLRGQSGGPVFDFEGVVWGMQSATNHLDLNFDVDQEVIRSGLKKRVRDSAFLHVGHCIHVDVLKDFMNEHKVQFMEK